MTKESITAIFHNQKDFFPSKNQSFNQYYVSQSFELHSQYDQVSAGIQFQPILDVLDQNFSSLKDLQILEIGGSSGILSKKLQDEECIVTMIETEKPFVDKAQERGVNAHLYNGSDLYPIIGSKQFEVIIANRVFEDIIMSEYQAKSLLTQTKKYLKPNGIFIIGTQNPIAIWENAFNMSGFKKAMTNQTPFHSYIKQTTVYNLK